MFAKRHYEAVAARLRNAKCLAAECALTQEDRRLIEGTWDTCVEELATMFARDREQFDRDRFLLACCDTVADRKRLIRR